MILVWLSSGANLRSKRRSRHRLLKVMHRHGSDALLVYSMHCKRQKVAVLQCTTFTHYLWLCDSPEARRGSNDLHDGWARKQSSEKTRHH